MGLLTAVIETGGFRLAYITFLFICSTSMKSVWKWSCHRICARIAQTQIRRPRRIPGKDDFWKGVRDE